MFDGKNFDEKTLMTAKIGSDLSKFSQLNILSLCFSNEVYNQFIKSLLVKI